MSEHNESRRKFIKATAYAAPVVLTLKAAPTFAKSGSMPVKRHGKHVGRHGQGHKQGQGHGYAHGKRGLHKHHR